MKKSRERWVEQRVANEKLQAKKQNILTMKASYQGHEEHDYESIYEVELYSKWLESSTAQLEIQHCIDQVWRSVALTS